MDLFKNLSVQEIEAVACPGCPGCTLYRPKCDERGGNYSKFQELKTAVDRSSDASNGGYTPYRK